MGGWRRAGAVLVSITLVVVSALLAVGPATAAGLPSYRSPGFKGKVRVPKTKPVPPPPPVVLSSGGLGPDMVVDDAGTAHVVWSEGRGDEADAVVYCRLKRTATGCDSSSILVPAKTYDPPDSPSYDVDNSGPHILQIGTQLVVLSYRYPTTFTRPDGPGSGGAVEWVSDDGGTTWSGGVLVGKYDVNGTEAIAFGPPDATRLLTMSQEGYCGACVQQIRGGAYDPDAAYLGDGGPDRNYNGSLTLDNGVPTATFSDLGNTSYIRRWTGVEPITSPSTWTPAAPVAGDEPTIAGGPSGLFLMNRPAPGGAFAVRRVTGDAFGPATPVTEGSGAVLARITQDVSGRLLAVWEQRDGSTPGVRLRTAPGGGGFGTSQLMVAGAAAGQLRAGSAEDGGGFVVANATGGIISPGQIVAAGFGTRAPTNRPGIAGLAGGGVPGATLTCERVAFGAVDVRSTTGCFQPGTGSGAGMKVSEGEIDLNGLRVIPDPGSKIVIDARKRTIASSGGVRVVLSGGGAQITLWHGTIALDLKADSPGSLLASFDTSKFGTDVLGFGAAGKVDVLLTSGGVRIPVSLQLPKYLGDVRGSIELIGRSGTGLQLDSLHVHVGNVLLGPLTVDHFDVDWQQGGTWSGDGRLVFGAQGAGGALDAKVRFDMGDFKEGSADYTPPAPGIVIGPAVYITQFGGTITLDPTHIAARVKIGAGAAVNGVSPVSVLGEMSLTAPSSGPFTLQATGTVSLFVFDVANARFRYVSDGYADFNGHIGLSLVAVSIDGDVNGFVDAANRTFGASAQAKVCLDFSIAGVPFPCIDGDLAVSQIGLAVCVGADLPALGHKTGGVELPWSRVGAATLANPVLLGAAIAESLRTPCHTDGYKVPGRARIAQAGGAVTVTLPGGLPTATVALFGQGGAPDVAAAGPGGRGIGPGGYVAKSPGAGVTYVVIDKPTAGTWTFTPTAASPPVVRVLQSDGYVPATVTAHLGGRGRARTIRYRLRGAGHGQTLRFVETGAFGTHVLPRPKGLRGTLRFAPADAQGGRRSIVAEILHDGLITDRRTIATFRAPGPVRPGRPGRVRVRRGRSSATITWGRARGAARYLVRVRGSHGLRREYVVRARRVRVTRLVRGDRIRATVTGLSASGRRGPTR